MAAVDPSVAFQMVLLQLGFSMLLSSAAIHLFGAIRKNHRLKFCAELSVIHESSRRHEPRSQKINSGRCFKQELQWNVLDFTSPCSKIF